MRLSSTWGKEPASGRGPDAGFTIVEVVIAIMIIGGSLLTIVGAAASSFGMQNMARQRQAAVAIGNDIMEQIRALPWADVTMGIRDDDTRLQKDPHLAHCRSNIYRLISCTESASATSGVVGTGEAIVKRKTGGQTPLVDNSGDVTLKGITYTWHAYVTQRIQTTATQSVTSPYRVTIFVDWTWKGRPMSTLVQSLMWSADGCLGRNVHPVTGPCVNGKSLTATASGPTITVCLTSCSTAGTPQLSVTLGRLDMHYTRELVAELSATATLPDGQSQTLLVDNDPISGTPARIATPLEITIPVGSWSPQSATFSSGGKTWYFKVSLGADITAKAVAGFQDGATAADCSALLTGTIGTPCMGATITGGSVLISAVPDSGNPIPLARVAGTGETWTAKGSLTSVGTGDTAVSTLGVSRLANAYLGSTGTLSSWGLYVGKTGTTLSSLTLSQVSDSVSLSTSTGAVASGTACEGVTAGTGTCPKAVAANVSPSGQTICEATTTGTSVPTTGFCVYPSPYLYWFGWPSAATQGTKSLQVGSGRVTGPTYVASYRVSQCGVTNSGGCKTDGTTVLSTVEIRIQFPTMTVTGAATDW